MSMIDLLNIKTPAETCLDVAHRAKERRRTLGLTQPQLAAKSGVSLGSLRRFEQTGEISFHSLARIAAALECQDDFDALFGAKAFKTIQEVIDAQRK